jgi:hypothetical protein
VPSPDSSRTAWKPNRPAPGSPTRPSRCELHCARAERRRLRLRGGAERDRPGEQARGERAPQDHLTRPGQHRSPAAGRPRRGARARRPRAAGWPTWATHRDLKPLARASREPDARILASAGALADLIREHATRDVKIEGDDHGLLDAPATPGHALPRTREKRLAAASPARGSPGPMTVETGRTVAVGARISGGADWRPDVGAGITHARYGPSSSLVRSTHPFDDPAVAHRLGSPAALSSQLTG